MINKTLLMLADKFGLTLTPELAKLYNEAYLYDAEAMEDYLSALASGSSMTGRVAELALFIDGLDKRYNQ